MGLMFAFDPSENIGKNLRTGISVELHAKCPNKSESVK